MSRRGWGEIKMLIVTLAMYTVTLVVGLGFFWTFDRQNRRLPSKWLITHVFLAILTFILWTASLSGYSWQKPKPVHPSNSPWSNDRRHQELRRRYHQP
ncbi:hypothetical protein SAMN00768000_0646 [Sulfobacillus thermosulfidooxidans DSM 9293]|uniref:Uncharacterized protein n=2 Tax=Sulfobacillus thermosulfidooxidans TaxID=28034 RepID=A0A1W1W8D8_SULTA|nr:hypothetical protein SAMN00768000_0646 [Sulfobacillus thermosulfidooxidans DSM 9293]